MYPTICQLGPLAVHSYGVMLAIAIIVCTFLLARDARPAGIDSNTVFDLVFFAIVGGLFGARIFYVLLNVPYFLEHPLEMIMIHRGGLAWQGGLSGGFLSGAYYVRKKSLGLLKVLDLSAPYLALGQAIGRLGCFLNGCCYGKEVAWGIYFPAHSAHLHPTQLYESACLFIIFLILKKSQKRSLYQGSIFVSYLFLAATLRFIIEFFRADHFSLILGLSIYQWVCLGVIVLSAVVQARIKKQKA